jgi:Leucine-rich repeat (LRR) protein
MNKKFFLTSLMLILPISMFGADDQQQEQHAQRKRKRKTDPKNSSEQEQHNYKRNYTCKNGAQITYIHTKTDPNSSKDGEKTEVIPYIQIETKDGHVFVVDKEVAQQSATIANLFDPKVQEMAKESDKPIQFNETSAPCMEALIDLMTRVLYLENKNIVDQIANKTVSIDAITQAIDWLKAALNENDNNLLEELVVARNFLDINGPAGIAIAVLAHKQGILNNKVLPYDILVDDALELSHQFTSSYFIERNEIYDEEIHYLSVQNLIDANCMPEITISYGETRLHLSRQHLTSLEGLGNIPGINNVVLLELNNNNISELQAGTFKKLTNLRYLDLSNNNISKLEAEVFKELNKLCSLNLSNNNISKLETGTFKGLNKLQYLNLSHNNISKLETGTFKGFNKPYRLNLSHNNISELQAGTFKGLNRLYFLYLNNNNISKLQAGAFSNLPKGTSINLSDNLANSAVLLEQGRRKIPVEASSSASQNGAIAASSTSNNSENNG